MTSIMINFVESGEDDPNHNIVVQKVLKMTSIMINVVHKVLKMTSIMIYVVQKVLKMTSII